jgi:ribonuclease BN (tRNA processing enzyme)
VKLTVVGCSGTFPGPQSPCSSYLFEHEGFSLLVDAGNGSIGSLQNFAGLLDVDAVAISHLHGDHYLDLVTYSYARRYHPSGQPGQLLVHGPRDTATHIAGAFGRPVGELVNEVYGFRSFTDGGHVEIGPFAVGTLRVSHPVETYAMRISAGGRTVSYSADTAPCDSLVGIAKDAEMLLCEASYHDGEDNPPDIHLTGSQAGEAASRAGVGRLVLTHLVPWGDPERSLAEAATTWSGPLERALTGAVYEL